MASDEAEGQQTVDLSKINACSPDWIDAPDPDMSPDDIARLLHLNDVAGHPASPKKSNILRTGDESPITGDLDAIALPAEGDLAGEKGEIKVYENISGQRGDVRFNKPLKKEDGKWVYDDEVAKVKAPAIIDIIINDVVKKTIILNLPDTSGLGDGYPSADDWNNLNIPEDVNVDDIVNAIVNDNETPELQNHAIVEFATPCMRDDKGCDFKLFIKPGQQLNENTIIGTVTLDGKQKKIRSIFSKGTVLADDELKTKFKRVYNTAGCDRHFIIENYTICGNATDINTEELDRVKDKFRREADLFQLITDNICESVLPFILLRRYTAWRYMAPGVKWERPNGRELFSEYMEHVNHIRERYQDDLMHMGSVDNIRATNGNLRKMKALGDEIIERRKRFCREIIEAYEEYKQTIDLCEYDPDYGDCKYLAHVHPVDMGMEDTSTKIGDTDYFNYYLALIAKLDLTTENQYAKKYYEILKKIIEERISREKYRIEDIQDEFNELYRKIVDRHCHDGFQRLDSVMNGLDDEPTSGDVMGWLAQHINHKQKNEYTDYSLKQMANMYMFVRGYVKYDGSNYKINE